MDSIRILHASDLHIADRSGLKSPIDSRSPIAILKALRYRSPTTSYDPTILSAFADFIRAEDSFDAVLLTGDIATTGSYGDLAKAIRFIEGKNTSPLFFGPSPPPFLEPSLAGIDAPIWLLPGNHDRFIRKRPDFFNPGGKAFQEVFSRYWTTDVRSYPVIEKPGMSVAVVAADFSLRKAQDCGAWPLNKYAQGKVYDDILITLEAETTVLKQAYEGELLIFWAIHFPPDYPGLSPRMKLIGSENIIASANHCGVKAVLAGHTHKQLKYSNQRMKFDVLCAGTVSEFEPAAGHHFQVINVTGQFDFHLDHYEYDPLLCEFRLS